MNSRLIIFLIVVVELLANRGIAQSTLPASQSTTGPVTAMDLASVTVEWNTSDSNPRVDNAPLVVVGGPNYQRSIRRIYWDAAVASRELRGSRQLLGYLGGPFPEGSAIVADSFERQGEQIRLVFRFDDKPAIAPKRTGDLCFFAATLNIDLPDGTYQVTVELKNLPADLADLKVAAIQRLEFHKPDPRMKRAQDEVELVKTLSSKDLIDRYRAHAAQMKGMDAPREGRILGMPIFNGVEEESERLAVLKREIIRRGAEIGPLLIDGLKEQALLNPDLSPRDDSLPPRGIARELMDMLAQIGDARAAEVMLDIISGKLNCNFFVTQAAVENIERLTQVRFRQFDSQTYASEAVRGPDATVQPFLPKDRKSYLRDLAPKYARWIAQHPAKDADATRWTNEALRMARAWLDGDDLAEAYNAAWFLRSGARRPRIVDDDPARTTSQLAAILEQCEVASSSKSDGYTFYGHRHKPTGQTLPISINSFTGLLTDGPSVPSKYAALLIRLEREMPENPGSLARDLWKVSGTEAMAYRVEVYTRLLADVNKLGINSQMDVSNMQDRTHLGLIMNCQYYRWGIERWAGRTFATDAELDAWWSAEKDKTQQQWLESGLPLTAAKADAGDRQSQYLLRLVLGKALPNKPDHNVWLLPGSSSEPPPRAEKGEPFRVRWLADHAGRLSCDVERGVFVLK